MPLFTRLGLEPDCTFEFSQNPDPDIYSEVVVAPAKTAKSAPTEES